MESLFRFMTLRPPEEVELDNSNSVSTENPNSQYQKALREAGSANALEGLIGQTREFMATPNYVTDLGQIAIPLKDFGKSLTETKPQDLGALEDIVRQIFPPYDAIQLVDSPEFLEAKGKLADSIIALSIIPEQEGDEYFYKELLQGIRLCTLIERIATQDVTLDNEWALEEALNQLVLLPDGIFPLPAPLPQTEIRMNEGDAIQQVEAEQQQAHEVLVERLGNLRTALDELSNVRASDFKQVEYAPDESAVELRADRVAVPAEPNPWVLSEDAINRLSQSTLAEINTLGIDLDTVSVPEATQIFERELIEVGNEVYQAPKPTEMVRIGVNFMALPEVFARADINPALEYANTGAFREIGVGDLHVVKQELQRYEAREIAHIENVLQGEVKERTHRRAKRTEETYLVETETTETTEKDLQSTERFELQQQTQETVKEDSQFSSDTTIKYGGCVDITTNIKYGTQDSKQKSQQSATSYARDITNRSVSRIEEKIREQRVRKLIQEIEETNVHKLKTSNEHVVGIYRWVDKVYKAQVYNYGERLMFELIVPEPAAFTFYANSKKSPAGLTVSEPESPKNPNKSTEDLKPEHIKPENYQALAAKYQVTDIKPPPPSQIFVPFKFQTEKGQDFKSYQDLDSKDFVIEGDSTTIKIPDGYLAQAGWGRIIISPFEGRHPLRYVYEGKTIVEVIVGTQHFMTTNDKWHPTINIDLKYHPSEIPVTVTTIHRVSVSVTLEILCNRTGDKLSKWQIDTYKAIMTAYLNLKSEYEDQLAAAAVEEGIAISGRNPKLNRELEKTELKKGALTLLTRKTSPHFDYVGSIDVIEKDVKDKHGYKKIKGHPEINFAEADREGPYIQFFEQAFEWSQMTYIFYPYFWARKQLWATLQQIEDNDPLHAQFLQAGAARVLVPVRRGYEDAIQYYLSTNKIAGPPKIGSKLYVPLVTAIKEQQGIDFSKRQGTISVAKDSKDVTGQDTKFIPDDIDREIVIWQKQDVNGKIVIRQKKYRIAKVESSTKLTLSENYTGETDNQVPYSIGLKLVGEPWEVKIPTSLVYLQQDKTKLPDFTDE